MRGRGRRRRQLGAQKRRIQRQVGQLIDREPLKNQVRVLLNAGKRRGVSYKRAVGRRADEVVQADLVVVALVVVKEVLGQPQQPLGRDGGAQLLAELTDHGAGRVLAEFAAAAGQRPERLVGAAMQQHPAAVEEHAGDAQIEAVGALIKRNHFFSFLMS